MIRKGIAIRIIGGGDGTFVVNEHFKAYKKSKNGMVTFSTDIQIGSSRAPELDSMIMYVAEKDTYVLAQIKDICVNPTPFIPEDNKFIESSPDRYRKEKRSWIIISDMRIINKDELRKYYVLYNMDGDDNKENYKKVMLNDAFKSSERIARVYYNYDFEENDDEFILIKSKGVSEETLLDFIKKIPDDYDLIIDGYNEIIKENKKAKMQYRISDKENECAELTFNGKCKEFVDNEIENMALSNLDIKLFIDINVNVSGKVCSMVFAKKEIVNNMGNNK